MKKLCPKCGEEKDVGEFYKSKNRKSGVTARCKECIKAESTKYRLANPDKVKAANDAYRLANPNYSK